MSNLKKQIASIRQQLAVSSAETIARLKKNETEIVSLREAVERLEKSHREASQAIASQTKVHETALDQLLELVAAEEQETSSRLDQVEERLEKLEQDRPPAA